MDELDRPPMVAFNLLLATLAAAMLAAVSFAVVTVVVVVLGTVTVVLDVSEAEEESLAPAVLANRDSSPC